MHKVMARRAMRQDIVTPNPQEPIPTSRERQGRIRRHTCQVQRTLARIRRIYGKQMADEVR
jgi:hypothetical protein